MREYIASAILYISTMYVYASLEFGGSAGRMCRCIAHRVYRICSRQSYRFGFALYARSQYWRKIEFHHFLVDCVNAENVHLF